MCIRDRIQAVPLSIGITDPEFIENIRRDAPVLHISIAWIGALPECFEKEFGSLPVDLIGFFLILILMKALLNGNAIFIGQLFDSRYKLQLKMCIRDRAGSGRSRILRPWI